MIGKAFIDPQTERIYHVSGVVPAYHNLSSVTAGALIVVRDSLEARLVSRFEADKIEGKLAFRVEVIMRADSYSYPAGTPFVLYRVADWKSGKVWATPLREFNRQFRPLDGGFIEALPAEQE
jgi:hypothetical protein